VKITDAGMKDLKELKHLTYLNLISNAVTEGLVDSAS